MTKRLRSGVTKATGRELRVDREAGVIRGYSLIERGEALGHGFWVDSKMLDQVAALGAAAKNGLKSRFTHPGLSADGLGKLLGKTHNIRREGDRVLGDLHLAESARKSPEGDLWEYTLSLAEGDPGDFGASIVFDMDYDAAVDEGSLVYKNHPEFGRVLVQNPEWESDDELNTENLFHGRVAALSASDLVDTPAANRGGLFGEELATGEAMRKLVRAALGTGRGTLEPVALGITDANAKAWLNQFLEEEGLMITRKTTTEPGVLSAPDGTAGGAGASVAERNGSAATLAQGPPMEDEEEEQASAETEDDELNADAPGGSDDEESEDELAGDAPPASEEDDEEESASELSAGRRRVEKLRAALGADVSAETLLSAVEEELTVGQALRRENEQLRAQVVELGKGKGFSGASKPMASFQPGEKKAGNSTPKSYLALIEEYKKETKCSHKEALRQVAKDHPEAYKAYTQGE